MLTNSDSLVLAICRDEEAFHRVLKQNNGYNVSLLIASDDLRVHQIGRQRPNIEIIYYDQMEPFFDVAPHVLNILSEVNRWLRALGDCEALPADLLYWVQHVEGGDTTQRIQDAVLEVRSCFALLDKYKPRKIIIGGGSRSYWEDLVVNECAKERKIPVQILINRKPRRLLADFWLRLRPLAKEVYRSALVILSILRRSDSRYGRPGYGEYVAVQLCSSAKKHLNHTLPLLKAFGREGMRAVAVTYGIGFAAQALRKQGYEVAELEAWVPPGILLRSWQAAFRGLWRSKRRLSTFLRGEKDNEYAQFVRPALVPQIRSFFIERLSDRIRLKEACRFFFSSNPPSAARLWTRILEQGVIAYKAMESVGVRPLLFWQVGWPYQLQWPYLRYDVPSDLTFCLSQAHMVQLQKEGKSGDKLFVVGTQWRGIVSEFASRNTRDILRRWLGIPKNAKLALLCDAQAVINGYCSCAEQALLVNAAVEFAERNEDVCVLIKPHIGHKPGQLETIFGQRGNGRVIWIPGSVIPYQGILAADLVITKFSTMAAEAMVLDVPTICVLLDRDMRWTIYEDAVDYALTIEDLMDKLEALRNREFYTSWQNELKKRHHEYIERHLPNPEADCNSLMAQRVREALSGNLMIPRVV